MCVGGGVKILRVGGALGGPLDPTGPNTLSRTDCNRCQGTAGLCTCTPHAVDRDIKHNVRFSHATHPKILHVSSPVTCYFSNLSDSYSHECAVGDAQNSDVNNFSQQNPRGQRGGGCNFEVLILSLIQTISTYLHFLSHKRKNDSFILCFRKSEEIRRDLSSPCEACVARFVVLVATDDVVLGVPITSATKNQTLVHFDQTTLSLLDIKTRGSQYQPTSHVVFALFRLLFARVDILFRLDTWPSVWFLHISFCTLVS